MALSIINTTSSDSISFEMILFCTKASVFHLSFAILFHPTSITVTSRALGFIYGEGAG